MKKIIIFILFTILPYSISSFYDNVFAQSNTREIIRISPFVFDITLSPNKTYEYEMTVENLLPIALPIRLSTEDFQVSEDTGAYTFEENNINSVVSWITIEQKEMILNPNEKKDIMVTIKTPEKISFGGYHGMVFIEPLFPNQKQYNSLLNTKIGALILANIGSPANGVNPARIPHFNTPYLLLDQNDFSYEFQVQSNSLYHFTARPFLHVQPLFGEEQKIALEEKLIFPGKSRKWEESKTISQLFPGIYTAELRVSLGNGVQTSTSQYFIYVPVYLLIVFILAGGCLIVFIKKKYFLSKLR